MVLPCGLHLLAGPLLTLSGGGQQGRAAAADVGRSRRGASKLQASASSAETASETEVGVGWAWVDWAAP